MHAQAQYMVELERAYNRTLYGQATLAEARQHTQRVLDTILNRSNEHAAILP